MFDNRYIAETPRKAPVMTVAMAPPRGRTASKGPSHEGGSLSAIEVGARVMLAVKHAAEYAV
jgi:hypothetical protein